MTYEDTSGETIGTKALTWVLIAGAALPFLEATWSPTMQVPAAKTPAVQTVTVQHHHERLAQR